MTTAMQNLTEISVFNKSDWNQFRKYMKNVKIDIIEEVDLCTSSRSTGIRNGYPWITLKPTKLTQERGGMYKNNKHAQK